MLGGLGSGSVTQMTQQSKALYPEKRNVGRAKYRSVWIANNLLKHNPKSCLRPGYTRTLTCNEVRTVKTKKGVETHHSSYCKNRWCPCCERIRMGKMINDYTPIFEGMKEPMFVTLTCRSVSESDTPELLTFMVKTFQRIMNLKKAKELRDSFGMHGIRKIECTEGEVPGCLHPHLHVLIDGELAAYWLLDEWLKRMGNKASLTGQKIKKADEGALIELCKYFAKESADSKSINYKRLDAIYISLRGRRLIQGFGEIPDFEDVIDSNTESEVEEILQKVEGLKLTPVEVKEEWEEESEKSYYYVPNQTDWVSQDGEHYCGFTPDETDVEKYEERKVNESKKEPPKFVLDSFTSFSKWPDLPAFSSLMDAKTPEERRAKRLWNVDRHDKGVVEIDFGNDQH